MADDNVSDEIQLRFLVVRYFFFLYIIYYVPTFIPLTNIN